MIRGTTPTIKIKVNELVLESVKKLFITFRQGDTIIEKELYDCEIKGDVIYVNLTQEETLKFSSGAFKLQLRALGNDDVAVASNIVQLSASSILKEGVIE